VAAPNAAPDRRRVLGLAFVAFLVAAVLFDPDGYRLVRAARSAPATQRGDQRVAQGGPRCRHVVAARARGARPHAGVVERR
jgi:hypothetical protein